MLSANVTFVSIDTVSIEESKNDSKGMLKLLDSTLSRADPSDWKIVFGHYPCYSGGLYSGSPTIREKVLPILERHKAGFFGMHLTPFMFPGFLEN